MPNEPKVSPINKGKVGVKAKEVNIVFKTMSHKGRPITNKTDAKLGAVILSFCPAVEDKTGALTMIFSLINRAKSGPLIAAVGNPTTNPNAITHPRLADKISATATGPGVGGIKAWVMAKPANKGRPYNKIDFPVLRCNE